MKLTMHQTNLLMSPKFALQQWWEVLLSQWINFSILSQPKGAQHYLLSHPWQCPVTSWPCIHHSTVLTDHLGVRNQSPSTSSMADVSTVYHQGCWPFFFIFLLKEKQWRRPLSLTTYDHEILPARAGCLILVFVVPPAWGTFCFKRHNFFSNRIVVF